MIKKPSRNALRQRRHARIRKAMSKERLNNRTLRV